MRTEITTKPQLRSKQDARMLHGIYCYRDRSESIEEHDKWSGTCICHNAVWHSCPNSSVGERIFKSLPDESTFVAKENNQIIELLIEIRDLLKERK